MMLSVCNSKYRHKHLPVKVRGKKPNKDYTRHSYWWLPLGRETGWLEEAGRDIDFSLIAFGKL